MEIQVCSNYDPHWVLWDHNGGEFLHKAETCVEGSLGSVNSSLFKT